MGLYSKVNKSFGRQFYFRKFDKNYLTFPDEEIAIEYLMSMHARILLEICQNKRDVVLENQEKVDFFLESLDRNRCPIDKSKFNVPLIVHCVMFSTPGDERYERDLQLLIENGVIPKKFIK